MRLTPPFTSWFRNLAAPAVSSILFLTSVQAEERPVWLAVGSPVFLKELAPLAELRTVQGFAPVLSSRPPEEAISACQPAPSYILLVGDEVWLSIGATSELQHWQIRAKRAPFYRWQDKQSPEFPSDMAYGDLDRDGMPEVPVGRIPARTKEEVAAAVKKTVAWEKLTTNPEDLRVPIWIGDPAYGPLFAKVSMSFLITSLSINAPKWLDYWILNGDAAHPLCGNPFDQPRLYNEQLHRGNLFTAMMGHGSTDHFWSFTSQGVSIQYNGGHSQALTQGGPTPPHIIFACSCGRYQSASKRCLAEDLLAAPGGPVLTVAASIESHPLTNYYTSTALLRALGKGIDRFGPLWISTQQDASRRTEREKEFLLAEVEGKLHGKMEPAMLKRDQVLMYNILGDPASRIGAPKKLEVSVEKNDGAWTWSLQKPAGVGALQVEWRPPLSTVFAPRNPSLPPAQANELLAQTNHALAFRPLEKKEAELPWTGQAKEKGTLRFLARGAQGELWAGGVDLR